MQEESQYITPPSIEPMAPSAPVFDSSPSGPIYPSLGNYMGLELSNEIISNNLPEQTVSTNNVSYNIYSLIYVYIIYNFHLL